MNNNIYTSRNDSICGRDVENKTGFNTNNNNNNGDDRMKNIEILTKKEFKALTKGEAYTVYSNIGERVNALKIKADKAEALFKDAKKDTAEAKRLAKEARKFGIKAERLANERVAKLEKALKKAKKDLKETKKALKEAELRAENAELTAATGEGKSDAGLDLVHEIQNDLDELTEEVVETRKAYSRIGARMTGKKARANINAGTIRHYNNIIRQCKKDIEAGKDVNGNKATIFELQAEIRNLQRQVDAANGTFNEMKRNKTVISQKIVAMDNELDKRYKLQNLLGELGYMWSKKYKRG